MLAGALTWLAQTQIKRPSAGQSRHCAQTNHRYGITAVAVAAGHSAHKRVHPRQAWLTTALCRSKGRGGETARDIITHGALTSTIDTVEGSDFGSLRLIVSQVSDILKLIAVEVNRENSRLFAAVCFLFWTLFGAESVTMQELMATDGDEFIHDDTRPSRKPAFAVNAV